MKGSFFQKPFEFKLTVEGQSWAQGEEITGSIASISHSNDSVPPLKLFLAYGAIKKVQAKQKDAFSDLIPISLEPGSESKWSLRLDPNCGVSENTRSPYLLYGASDDPSEMGQLQISIRPQLIFLEFAEVIERNWKYVTKTTKSKKDFVEFKMAPPSGGQGIMTVDQLFLLLRKHDEILEAKLVFNLNRVDAMSASLKMKKEKKEIELIFEKEDYLLFNGHLKKEFIEAEFGRIIDDLKGPL